MLLDNGSAGVPGEVLHLNIWWLMLGCRLGPRQGLPGLTPTHGVPMWPEFLHIMEAGLLERLQWVHKKLFYFETLWFVATSFLRFKEREHRPYVLMGEVPT